MHLFLVSEFIKLRCSCFRPAGRSETMQITLRSLGYPVRHNKGFENDYVDFMVGEA